MRYEPPTDETPVGPANDAARSKSEERLNAQLGLTPSAIRMMQQAASFDGFERAASSVIADEGVEGLFDVDSPPSAKAPPRQPSDAVEPLALPKITQVPSTPSGASTVDGVVAACWRRLAFWPQPKSFVEPPRRVPQKPCSAYVPQLRNVLWIAFVSAPVVVMLAAGAGLTSSMVVLDLTVCMLLLGLLLAGLYWHQQKRGWQQVIDHEAQQPSATSNLSPETQQAMQALQTWPRQVTLKCNSVPNLRSTKWSTTRQRSTSGVKQKTFKRFAHSRVTRELVRLDGMALQRSFYANYTYCAPLPRLQAARLPQGRIRSVFFDGNCWYSAQSQRRPGASRATFLLGCATLEWLSAHVNSIEAKPAKPAPHSFRDGYREVQQEWYMALWSNFLGGGVTRGVFYERARLGIRGGCQATLLLAGNAVDLGPSKIPPQRYGKAALAPSGSMYAATEARQVQINRSYGWGAALFGGFSLWGCLQFYARGDYGMQQNVEFKTTVPRPLAQRLVGMGEWPWVSWYKNLWRSAGADLLDIPTLENAPTTLLPGESLRVRRAWPSVCLLPIVGCWWGYASKYWAKNPSLEIFVQNNAKVLHVKLTREADNVASYFAVLPGGLLATQSWDTPTHQTWEFNFDLQEDSASAHYTHLVAALQSPLLQPLAPETLAQAHTASELQVAQLYSHEIGLRLVLPGLDLLKPYLPPGMTNGLLAQSRQGNMLLMRREAQQQTQSRVALRERCFEQGSAWITSAIAEITLSTPTGGAARAAAPQHAVVLCTSYVCSASTPAAINADLLVQLRVRFAVERAALSGPALPFSRSLGITQCLTAEHLQHLQRSLACLPEPPSEPHGMAMCSAWDHHFGLKASTLWRLRDALQMAHAGLAPNADARATVAAYGPPLLDLVEAQGVAATALLSALLPQASLQIESSSNAYERPAELEREHSLRYGDSLLDQSAPAAATAQRIRRTEAKLLELSAVRQLAEGDAIATNYRVDQKRRLAEIGEVEKNLLRSLDKSHWSTAAPRPPSDPKKVLSAGTAPSPPLS